MLRMDVFETSAGRRAYMLPVVSEEAKASASNYAIRAYSIMAYLLDTKRQPGVGWQNTSTP
jgi:hypothetical protein